MAIKTPASIIAEICPRYAKGPTKEYLLTYDSSSQTLEPVYFWILDFMNNLFSGKVKKLVDNFTSSPGSGHFSELMMKATRMQEESMKIYGMVNTVIKSVINLLYDLKEFQIRLKNYDDANSKNKDIAIVGLLSLKQIWMDQVDIKRGRGSINMLAQDLNFVTLRDAFMAVNTLKEIDKVDLNERVRRILKIRLEEFLEWQKRSETELRKRFEIEKTYLKTQVNTVKSYARWAKPYLIAAEQLRMKEQDRYDPNIVNTFNTIILELTLLGQKQVKVAEASIEHELPEGFKNMKMKRDYFSCVLINFKFRGIPQKIAQQGHFAFGGKADVSFSSYALNSEELELLQKKLEESDFDSSLKLVEGMTEDSLGQLKQDIEEFLEDKGKKQANEKAERDERNVNPFAALLGLNNKKKENPEEKPKSDKKEIKDIKDIKKDSYAESVIRDYAEAGAKSSCYTVYDIYKKGHGMASTPGDA